MAVSRESKPSKSAVKKGNIISLKRRDAVPATEFSQNLSSSKGTLVSLVKVQGGNNGNERNSSVGADGNQVSKRS